MVLVNLDPANDVLSYKVDVDVRDFISVKDVMELLNTGPNESFFYCIDMIWCNMQWLCDQFQQLHEAESCVYFLIAPITTR